MVDGDWKDLNLRFLDSPIKFRKISFLNALFLLYFIFGRSCQLLLNKIFGLRSRSMRKSCNREEEKVEKIAVHYHRCQLTILRATICNANICAMQNRFYREVKPSNIVEKLKAFPKNTPELAQYFYKLLA